MFAEIHHARHGAALENMGGNQIEAQRFNIFQFNIRHTVEGSDIRPHLPALVILGHVLGLFLIHQADDQRHLSTQFTGQQAALDGFIQTVLQGSLGAGDQHAIGAFASFQAGFHLG